MIHNRLKTSSLALLLLAASAWGCGDSSTSADGQGETTENAAAVSENFKGFLVNFKPLKESKTFGEDWLGEYNAFSDIAQVSPEMCKSFIYGNQVLNHNLGDGSENIKIPDGGKYFHVALTHEEPNFIGLIFTDNVPDKTMTYFCTYTREGKFVSGMVIQAYQVAGKDGDEQYFTREGGITFENKSMILVKEIVPGKGTQLMSYRLDSNGVITKG